MIGYVGNIEEETKKNTNFRKVLFTGPNSQLVVMSLKPGEDIGMEVHDDVDQFIRVESGIGEAILDKEKYKIEDDWAVVIPAGVEHNIVNTSADQDMKVYTIYTPPQHPENTVHKTKQEAMKAEHS